MKEEELEEFLPKEISDIEEKLEDLRKEGFIGHRAPEAVTKWHEKLAFQKGRKQALENILEKLEN